MMYHHSDTPYSVAAEKCSQHIRTKFERQIEEGRVKAQHTIQMLQQNQPEDNYIWHDDMVFDVDRETGKVILSDKKKPDLRLDLHRNAVSQAAGTEGVNIPVRYLDRLIEDKQYDLVEQNLNTRFHNLPILEKSKRPRRFNARSVRGEARGIVSDAFARWNTNMLVEAFVKSVMDRGGVMVHAVYTDLQFSLKAVWPEFFEPATGEVMLFGISMKRSDFGLSPLSLESLVNRPWCTNLATMESVYTKKNISVRYNDSEVFSQETMDKETIAHASAIGEMVDKYLHPKFIGMQANAVHAAANTPVASITEAIGKLKKQGVTAEEAAQVKEYYESKEAELLPQGDSVWRLSNCLSLLAQNVSPDRGLELEKVAGQVAGLLAA